MAEGFPIRSGKMPPHFSGKWPDNPSLDTCPVFGPCFPGEAKMQFFSHLFPPFRAGGPNLVTGEGRGVTERGGTVLRTSQHFLDHVE